MINNPVFIIGLNKSGTSLLYLMMSKHSELSAVRSYQILKEPKSGKRKAMLHMADYGIGEGQRIPGIPQKMGLKGGPGRWAAPQFIKEYKLNETNVECGDREALTLAYERGIVDPSKRLLEKSPPNLLRSRYLQALFPDATFIATIRHPMANVAANAKKKSNWGSVSEQAYHWNQAYQNLLIDKEKLSSFMLVKYEEMVKNTEKILSDIFRTCNLSMNLNMLRAVKIEKNVNQILFDMLSDDEKGQILDICGDTMSKYGYEV
jgi:hypothetical protein